MQTYRSSAALKTMAKGQLLGNYPVMAAAFLSVFLIALLLQLITLFFTDQSTVIGTILSDIVTFLIQLLLGILCAGISYMSLKICCKEPVHISDLFYGFQYQPDKMLLIQFLLGGAQALFLLPVLILQLLSPDMSGDLYVILFAVFRFLAAGAACCLSLFLSQAVFLLLDFADRSPKEILKTSCLLMKGHKKRLFLIWLSFLPLFLLGVFSCGIGFLWAMPYFYVTMANFYMDLMQNQKGETPSPSPL